MMRLLSASTGPPPVSVRLPRPSASSMKMTVGAFLRASSNRLLDLLDTDAVVLRAEIASCDGNEIRAAFAGERLRKSRLADARAARHQDAAWSAHAHADELHRVGQVGLHVRERGFRFACADHVVEA